MAEPLLTSSLFADVQRLQDCREKDSAHVQLNRDKGVYVARIQKALLELNVVGIMQLGTEYADKEEDCAYGSFTAAAVLKYKNGKTPPIRSPGQTVTDNIVGKRTIRSLDDDLNKKPAPRPSPTPVPPQSRQFIFQQMPSATQIKYQDHDRTKQDLLDTGGGGFAITRAKVLLAGRRRAKNPWNPLPAIPTQPTVKECEEALLEGTGKGGTNAQDMASYFMKNMTRASERVFPAEHFWSNAVKNDVSFKENHEGLSDKIKESLQEQVKAESNDGYVRVDVGKLALGPNQPKPLDGFATTISFNAIGLSDDATRRRTSGDPLAYGIGDIQGIDVRITTFSGEANGEYKGTLNYAIYDHYGSDDSDVWADAGQAALYLLQRGLAEGQDTSRYKPYIVKIIVNAEFSGKLE
jgi:hypothetical protein